MADNSILVVDDDPKIRTLLRNVLEGEGFAVREAETAAQVMAQIADSAPVLVTLDIHLGAENGIEIAREIRRTSHVPIIMDTGKDDVIDRVVGLEVGADDYITKPFHVREVIARVRSVLRRSDVAGQGAQDTATVQGTEASVAYRFDGLTAIPDQLELLDRDDAPSGLTSGDFKLLTVFLTRPKRVLSRDQLMDLTGGTEWNPLDRAIDNQIARLRKKIERDPSDPKLIKTVRGVGYTFAQDVEVVQSPCASKSA
jgi:DNA-binding response OmpR family regulator